MNWWTPTAVINHGPEFYPDGHNVPPDHWHEGTRLVGYWKDGESYVFRGLNGHHLCVSRGFLQTIRPEREAQLEAALRRIANLDPHVYGEEDFLEARDIAREVLRP